MGFAKIFIQADCLKNFALLVFNTVLVILQYYGRIHVKTAVEMLCPLIIGAGSSILFGITAAIYVAIKLHKEKNKNN